MEFLVNLYREHGNKRLFCDSIFDLKEQLVALQLVMAQLNKEVKFSTLHICKVMHISMLSYGVLKGAGVLVLVRPPSFTTFTHTQHATTAISLSFVDV